jgi:hypothetical protein
MIMYRSYTKWRLWNVRLGHIVELCKERVKIKNLLIRLIVIQIQNCLAVLQTGLSTHVWFANGSLGISKNNE